MKRHDIYGRAHKALRAAMGDVMVVLGRTDPADECEVLESHARLEELLALCEEHAALENAFIHRAIEERRPGAACAFAAEHETQADEVERLRAAAAARAPDLHRRVAAFVARNLLHMEDEEASGNALLWAIFDDAELAAIEHRLVASKPPGRAMQALRWMIPAMNHTERVATFTALAAAPAAAREAALGLAQTHLRRGDMGKLAAALAQRDPATLES
ncbi:MAG: hypothetical protein ACM3SO_06370 [Betaproteobacteria bacterium]